MRAILVEAFFLALFPSVAATAVFVGIVAWFFRLQIDSRFKMRSLPYDVPITIFVLLGAISVFLSPARSFTLIYNYCGLVGVYGLTYVLIGQNVRTYRQLKNLARALGASTLLVVLWGYFQYIFGIDISDMKWVDGEAFPELRKRIFSTLENPNVLAGYLDVMICLTLGVLSKVQTGKQKIFLIVVIAMLAACLAMTYSRGAFLTISIVFIIYGLLQDWRILILFAGLTGIIIYSDATFLDRILSVFTTTNDSSEGLRLGIWVSTISMIADHPFVGIGWGAYKFIYPQYNYYLADPNITIYHAHNLYLNVAAEVGIVGALAFFWYFFGTMLSTLELNTNDRYQKLREETLDATKNNFKNFIQERLVKTFLTSNFLQILANSKALFITRMADFANQIMDKFSFTSSEAELRKAGKKDEDISDEDIKEDIEEMPEKNSEPELVHHEDMKWSSPPLAEKKSDDDKKDDDDKIDLQKFASDDEIDLTPPKDLYFDNKKLAEGLKFGVGLAFLSMALNGVTDDLLFNIPSSMLMWMLAAIGASADLLQDEKKTVRRGKGSR